MHSWEKNIIRPTFGSFQDQSIQLHFTVAVPSNTPTGNQSHPITEAVPSNTPTGSQSHPFTAVVPSNTPTGSQSHPVTAAIPSSTPTGNPLPQHTIRSLSPPGRHPGV